jgi:hypothetical protein
VRARNGMPDERRAIAKKEKLISEKDLFAALEV